MKIYYGIVHKDEDSAYGVQFPDLPGCFSAADTAEEIIPNASEAVIVERDIRLTEITGGRYHVAHISTAEAVDAVRKAKARGLRLKQASGKLVPEDLLPINSLLAK